VDKKTSRSMKAHLERRISGPSVVNSDLTREVASPQGRKESDQEQTRAKKPRVLAERLAEEVRSQFCNENNPARSSNPSIMLDKEIEGYRVLITRMSPTADAPVSFSPRELEIARMIAKGYPNKTIAGVLEISTWTVGTHLRRIFAKLRVGSRAAMVARLISLGLARDWLM